MKTARIAVFLAILALIGTATPAIAQTAEGVPNMDSFIIVADQHGNPIGMYPKNIYIDFTYNAIYGINESGNVTYKILDKGWMWWFEPPDEVYIPDINATVKLKYEVRLDAVAGAMRTMHGNETYTNAGVAVTLHIRMYIAFANLPNVTGTLPIGYYIVKYGLYGVNPAISYYVIAERYRNGEPEMTDYFSNDVTLDLEPVSIKLYGLVFEVKNVTIAKYVATGTLDTGVSLKPLYNLTFCGNLINNTEGEMELMVSVENSETMLKVDGDPSFECATLHGIMLSPKANQSIPVVIRTGAFILPLNFTEDVPGAVITAGKASGRAIGETGTWEAVITVPVYVSGYYRQWPPISVSATVTNTYFGAIPCKTLEIRKPGAYVLVCNKTVAMQLTSAEILRSAFNVDMTIVDGLGKPHTFKGVATMGAFDPSNIADVAWEVYQYASRTLLMGMVGVVVLLIISILKESITGYPLIDPAYLRGALLTLAVAVVLLQVAIPYVYATYTNLLSNLPLFRRYVTPPPSNDPKTVFTHLIGYYEKTFESIERDYQEMFVASINSILATIGGWVAVALVAIVVALALSTPFTPGGGIPFSSVATAILSVVFTFLGMILMIAPAGAIVLVGVAIGRLVIIIVTAVVVAMMALGVLLMCIPSPMSQRLGEDFFGAGVLYFIAFPMIAPITYSLYSYVVETAGKASVNSINVALGIASFAIPLAPIVRIMVYFVASGVAMLMIVMSLSYILSRTGIATGIGEALSGLVWRG